MTDETETDVADQLGAPSSDGDYARQVAIGLLIALALAVLTVIEYIIAVGIENPLIWLLPFIVAKGALIMEYFMHFSTALRGGEH
jgi:hypothetical protein